jgi:hypothetical protein
MKIYGVSVVQNESDVIAESLTRALSFCERIWVWDLGSTDGTWEALDKLRSDRIIPKQQTGLRFTSSLKGRVFAEARAQIEEGAWIYILDADEFLVGDPQPALKAAEREGAARVGVWQVNFFPVRTDLERLNAMGETSWEKLPLVERFRHYRVEWFEWRFIRVIPELVWDVSGMHSRFSDAKDRPLKNSRQELLVRHYRYRSPRQVAGRAATRRDSPPADYGQFRYETTGDFAKLVLPANQCREWPDPSTELIVPQRELLRARLCMGWTRILRKIERTVRRLHPGRDHKA